MVKRVSTILRRMRENERKMLHYKDAASTDFMQSAEGRRRIAGDGPKEAPCWRDSTIWISKTLRDEAKQSWTHLRGAASRPNAYTLSGHGLSEDGEPGR